MRRPVLARVVDLGGLADLRLSTPEQRSIRKGRWTRRVVLQDAALAAGLAVLTAGPLVHEDGASLLAWLLDLGLVVPLALRRRDPARVFAVVALLACVQWVVGLRLAADAGLLLALYTVAAHEPRGRAVAAAVVLEIGVVLAAVRFAPTGDGVIGSLVFLTGLVAAAFLLGTSLQTRSAYLAGLEDRALRLEVERDQQARLIQVAERTRIAREMHDIVAHNLSVMITLSAGAAGTTGTDPENAATAMRQVAQTGRDALAEMRQLLGFLREDGEPLDTAPQPGLDQLGDLLAQVRSTGLRVRLRVQGRPRPLAMTTQLTVYRAVQEALINTLKHGTDVTTADVLMDWQPGALELVVTDDGTRAAPAGAADGLGMGLVGVRERVRAAGGTATAGSRPTGGWLVRVHLPLEGDEP